MSLVERREQTKDGARACVCWLEMEWIEQICRTASAEGTLEQTLLRRCSVRGRIAQGRAGAEENREGDNTGPKEEKEQQQKQKQQQQRAPEETGPPTGTMLPVIYCVHNRRRYG